MVDAGAVESEAEAGAVAVGDRASDGGGACGYTAVCSEATAEVVVYLDRCVSLAVCGDSPGVQSVCRAGKRQLSSDSEGRYMLVFALLLGSLVADGSPQDVAYIKGSEEMVTEDPETGDRIITDPETGAVARLRNFGRVVFYQTTVRADQKLPLRAEGRTVGGIPAPVTDLSWSVDPSEAGAVELPAAPGLANAYFVPSDDFIGMVTIGVSGQNVSGVAVSGSLVVEVMPAPAAAITVVALEPIQKDGEGE